MCSTREEIISELEEIILDINLFLTLEFGNEFSAVFQKKFANLTPNQQMTLFLVDVKGVNQPTDLARALNISTSAISQIVGKLEAQDILKRSIDPTNRRSTIIEIGPKGRDLLDAMNSIKSLIFSKYLTKMEDEDLLAFKNSFRKFLSIIVTKNKEDK